MHPIMPPASEGPYPDRHLHCQMHLERGFQDLFDAAVAAGWSIEEAATALVDLADNNVLSIMANVETDAAIGRALKR